LYPFDKLGRHPRSGVVAVFFGAPPPLGLAEGADVPGQLYPFERLGRQARLVPALF
jgi:hypothetical protein